VDDFLDLLKTEIPAIAPKNVTKERRKVQFHPILIFIPNPTVRIVQTKKIPI
jgi:hypothetical protein